MTDMVNVVQKSSCAHIYTRGQKCKTGKWDGLLVFELVCNFAQNAEVRSELFYRDVA